MVVWKLGLSKFLPNYSDVRCGNHYYFCSEEILFRNEKSWKNNIFDPVSANPTKWSNTLKRICRQNPTNCLSVFDHFIGLTLNGLRLFSIFTCTFTFRRTPVETRTRKKINLHLTQFYQTVESYIGRMNAVFTFSANNSCCSVIIDQIFCSVRADSWPNFQLTVT